MTQISKNDIGIHKKNSLDNIRIESDVNGTSSEYHSLLGDKIEDDITITNPPQNESTPTSNVRISRKEWIMYIICFAFSIIIWNIKPSVDDDTITSTSMHLLSVFVLIVLLLLFTKSRISIVIAFSLAFLSLTQNFKCKTADHLSVDCSRCGKQISPDDDTIYKCQGSKGAFMVALSGYSDPVNWLVLFAYQIGKCIETTGLGKRISYIILKHCGTSLKGIGYSIFVIELVLAPFIPSNVARGGCIVLPIITSMIENISSNYYHSSKISDFLYLCGNHANFIISSIYLTGSASNPVLVSKVVSTYGSEYDISFLKWFLGALIPGALSIIVMPNVISYAVGMKNMDVRLTKHHSIKMLTQMKEMSKKEKQLCFVFIVCLTLWLTSSLTGIDATLVTFLGVLLLLTFGVLSWNDVIENKKAWDTFFWLGGMIVMANQLTEVGISSLLGEYIAEGLKDISISAVQIFIISSCFFFSMFFFSSPSGHVIALAAPFMSAAEKLGIPKGLTTAFLAYYTLLCASLTHYSSGTSVMYFGQGRIPTKRFILVGAIVGIVNVLIYSTVGAFWWKIIG